MGTTRPLDTAERVLYVINEIGLFYVDRPQVCTVMALSHDSLHAALAPDKLNFKKLLDAARLAACIAEINGETPDLEQKIADSMYLAGVMGAGYEVFEFKPTRRPTAQEMCDVVGFYDSSTFMAFFKRLVGMSWTDFWKTVEVAA